MPVINAFLVISDRVHVLINSAEISMYWEKCRNGISRIYGSGKISGKLVLTKKTGPTGEHPNIEKFLKKTEFSNVPDPCINEAVQGE